MKFTQIFFITIFTVLACLPYAAQASVPAKEGQQFAEVITDKQEEKMWQECWKCIACKDPANQLSKVRKKLAKVINKSHKLLPSTLLIKAVTHGNIPLIRYLHKEGAKPYRTQVAGPLHVAMSNRAKNPPAPIIQALIDCYGKDILRQDRDIALIMAANQNDLECIGTLLKDETVISAQAKEALSEAQLSQSLAKQVDACTVGSIEENSMENALKRQEAGNSTGIGIIQHQITQLNAQKSAAEAAAQQKKREAIIKRLADAKAEKERAEKEKRGAEIQAAQKQAQIAAAKLAEERLRANALEEVARLEAARAADAAQLKAGTAELDRLANERNAAESELRRQKQTERTKTQAQKEIDEQLKKEQERAAAESRRATKEALKNAPAMETKIERPKREKAQVQEEETLTREQARLLALKLDRQAIELKLKAAKVVSTAKKEEGQVDNTAPSNAIDIGGGVRILKFGVPDDSVAAEDLPLSVDHEPKAPQALLSAVKAIQLKPLNVTATAAAAPVTAKAPELPQHSSLEHTHGSAANSGVVFKREFADSQKQRNMMRMKIRDRQKPTENNKVSEHSNEHREYMNQVNEYVLQTGNPQATAALKRMIAQLTAAAQNP